MRHSNRLFSLLDPWHFSVVTLLQRGLVDFVDYVDVYLLLYISVLADCVVYSCGVTIRVVVLDADQRWDCGI